MTLHRTTLIAAALVALGTTAATAAPEDKAVVRHETELAKALKGKVAGAPVDCIQLRDIRSTRVIDRTAIVYELTGGRTYVNRPDGANTLDWTDILVTDTRSPMLCSIDVVRLVDRTSLMPSGFVGLNKFVPYKKAT
jgi:hypothetical protein